MQYSDQWVDGFNACMDGENNLILDRKSNECFEGLGEDWLMPWLCFPSLTECAFWLRLPDLNW